jgi:hypothetical protein
MSGLTSLSNSKKYQQWYDEKCMNFISWALTMVDKYSVVVGQSETNGIADTLKKSLNGLLEDEFKRQMYFSKMARIKLLENSPFFEKVAVSSVEFFDMDANDKEFSYDMMVSSVESIQSGLASFIKTLKERREDVMEDITHFAGYVSIVFGPLVKDTINNTNRSTQA